MFKVDLHSHTTCSDGQLTPAELIERATARNISLFAITDHDTVEACTIAAQYITDNQLDIRLVSGVEISSAWENKEIHIVGLNLDCEASELTTLLSGQAERRAERAQRMSDKLERVGLKQGFDKLAAGMNPGAITRTHFARLMVDEGLVPSMNKAFDKFLAKGNIGFVRTEWPDYQSVIATIHQAGGKAVLAHPAKYKMGNKHLRRLLADFKQAGGDAMEIANSQQSPAERSFLGQLSLEHNLTVSVGSDFHFPSPWTELGKNLIIADRYSPVWDTF